MKPIKWLALIILIIGGLNWGMIALLRFDIFFVIFGPMTALTRAAYALFGLAGLYIALIAKDLLKD